TLALAALSFVLKDMTDWRLSIFGLITLLVVYYLQDGILGYMRQAFGWRGPGRADAEAAARLPPADDALSGAAAARGRDGRLLEASQVLMQFGGLKALNQVDLRV